MPFTVSPSSYRGGDYLFQGISNAANSITGAIKEYQDMANQGTQARALMTYLSQQVDPVTGKPVIDDKAMKDFLHHDSRQQAYIAGGMRAGMATMQALGHYAAASQRVPYTVGGQTYNIPPSQAAQLQTQQANKVPAVPTEVGGKTINLPPSSAAQAELEKQRIDLAKQPKGLTQHELFQQQVEKEKAFQEKIKSSPEYDFTKKYAVQPQQVLTPDVLNIPQPGKPSPQAYQLFAKINAQGKPDPTVNAVPIQPEYDEYGVPRVPSYAASSDPNAQPYWKPTTSIFRESKYESNVGGTKQTYHKPDPSGELVNIGGQRIPYSAIQGINTRHDQLLKQATAALGQGADWQALAKQWAALGYNVGELPEPPQQ
jgi:hypothetical protein